MLEQAAAFVSSAFFVSTDPVHLKSAGASRVSGL